MTKKEKYGNHVFASQKLYTNQLCIILKIPQDEIDKHKAAPQKPTRELLLTLSQL
jgi:hypothetical protein